LMGLVLTAGSASLVFAHICPPQKGCTLDAHVVGESGIHYCIYLC
jgi:hypothetical protein